MSALDEAKDNIADGFESVVDAAEDAAELIIAKAEEAKRVIAEKLGPDEDAPGN